MSDTAVLYLIIFLHMAMVFSTGAYASLRGRKVIPAWYVWMSLAPVFGPIAGWLLLARPGKAPGITPDAVRGGAQKKEALHQMPFMDMVPLEESLLLDAPEKRRAAMMHILRSDPLQYLDLLLLARFNDDSETAHYATATIMELQRHFQLRIHHLRKELAGESHKADLLREYAMSLNGYCQSGLLEGQLLRRQRLLLKQALENCLRLTEDQELLGIKVRNSLALKETGEAMAAANKLIKNWPTQENSWLEGFRVCVETHDQACLVAFKESMRNTPVDYSRAGREHLLYWEGKHL